MEEFAQVFIKSFTRYFIPGLVALIIDIYLPLILINDGRAFEEFKLFDITHVLIFSIILGYLLDSFGAYRWTLNYYNYKRERSELSKKLSGLLSSTTSNDPDQYLAQLWIHNENLYNRLLVERAEWVMILESSFVLLFSGVIIIISLSIEYFLNGFFKFWGLFLPIIFIILSYISSQKGVQRMRAHNIKMIEAIQNIEEK